MAVITKQSEKGSALLTVLVVLVLISMIGFAAINTTTTELKLSHNSRCYKQNVYRAEAAIMEIAQSMELDTNPGTNLIPGSSASAWLTDGSGDTPEFSPETQDWVFSGSDSNATRSPIFYDPTSPDFPDETPGYSVVFEGLAPGASFSMKSTQMWQYGIYGLSRLCNGEIGVVAGYRRRF